MFVTFLIWSAKHIALWNGWSWFISAMCACAKKVQRIWWIACSKARTHDRRGLRGEIREENPRNRIPRVLQRPVHTCASHPPCTWLGQSQHTKINFLLAPNISTWVSGLFSSSSRPFYPSQVLAHAIFFLIWEILNGDANNYLNCWCWYEIWVWASHKCWCWLQYNLLSSKPTKVSF